MMQINLVCTPVISADDRTKEDFIMVFPLTKLNKEGTLLNASNAYYLSLIHIYIVLLMPGLIVMRGMTKICRKPVSR